MSTKSPLFRTPGDLPFGRATAGMARFMESYPCPLTKDELPSTVTATPMSRSVCTKTLHSW